MIREEGATPVGPAPSLAEAMQLIDTVHMDCGILDLEGRGERSYPAADALMKMQVPFAFVTAHTKATVPNRFINRPIVQKPLDALKLVETMCTCVIPTLARCPQRVATTLLKNAAEEIQDEALDAAD